MATLPSGYTQLKYIQSSNQTQGSPYIKTGFTPTANTRVVMDFQLTTAGSNNACLFGVAGQFSFRWFGSSSYFRSNGDGNANFPTGINGTARHTVDKTATTCTLDGEYTVTNTPGTVSNQLFLLAQNTGTNASNYADAKLYSCQIYESGSLVRDFVPCANASGTVGLYDTVNGVFYSSSSAATFTSGDVYDPTAPAGKHNALIDGTARAITGGNVLVDGTVREMDLGKTMIDGTEYEIAFPSVVTVYITSQSGTLGTYSYVSIGGKQYKSDATLEVEPGASYTVRADVMKAEYSENCFVYLNGVKVKTGSGTNGAVYSSTVPDCKTITFEYKTTNTGASIYITTT